jgi:hypothetical protein
VRLASGRAADEDFPANNYACGGAALGALGLSVFVARFQVELIVLSIVLLGVGLIQILRSGRSCRRCPKANSRQAWPLRQPPRLPVAFTDK